MKRTSNLWPEVVSWDNLVSAARRARRGKRFKAGPLLFEHDVEAELLRLQAELTDGSYSPGAYRAFIIHEPKRRLISAAPYRDRVVHHALCRVIEPIFERTFLGCSYANRTGYGTHRALRRFTRLLRSSDWVLRCDIRQYFPSIDHEILKGLIRRKIKCRPTLELIDRIIDGSNQQEPVDNPWFRGDTLLTGMERRRGLPIGNLTSQFFANVYLNSLDHLVVEQLRTPGYVRYVDDFALFGDDLHRLIELRDQIVEHLYRLRLRLHPAKTQLFRTAVGASFVGFRVLPDRIRIRSENLRRARRRLRRYQAGYRRGELSPDELTKRVRSWIAHLEHADTWRLREEIFGSLAFVRGR